MTTAGGEGSLLRHRVPHSRLGAMLVLTATSISQGLIDGDRFEAVEGELVVLLDDCEEPTCDCSRSFVGLASHRPTTTAVVADLQIGTQEFLNVLTDAMVAGGWLLDQGPDMVAETIARVVLRTSEVADTAGVDHLVRREGDHLYIRHRDTIAP